MKEKAERKNEKKERKPRKKSFVKESKAQKEVQMFDLDR